MPDEDWERESRYRKALGKRANEMTLLTKYFGEIETSKGKGYVFERVHDYDDKPSKTMLNLFEDAIHDKNILANLEKILFDFKHTYFAEKILLAGIDADNYLVQRISPTENRVRIIDNVGTSAFIPLAYYFDSLAEKRAKKYWLMFVKELSNRYKILFSEEFLRKLAEFE